MAADIKTLPIAVIGAGPIGLAAAAHLIERGLPVRVYEAGTTVGANLRDWGHVRIFTPWRHNIDAAARRILARHGWQAPPAEALPTGDELCDLYLVPLARTPELAPAIETGARVLAIARQGLDKVTSRGREDRPFEITIRRRDGSRRQDLARAVIDASGTWNQPNPIGASGLPAEGEAEHADRIAYGMPDLLGQDRALYAGRRTLVIGAGYSAANVLLDLIRLRQDAPDTRAHWAVRGTNLARVYGGGDADQIPARGALGWQLKEAVERGAIALTAGFAAIRVREDGQGLWLDGDTAQGSRSLGPVDRIVVATGQRPDLAMTRELRLELDPWLEGAKALGPLIDPNLHSCGTVPPHGHRELSHPEPGFYTVGVKSYGRAPTFLLLTGYEQARSVAAALAGDRAAADDVQLVLPETGICEDNGVESGHCCGSPQEESAVTSSGCCGGSAPVKTVPVEACCAPAVVAKDEARTGCGCGVAA
ncbi:MAG TPA: NAD(P)-binding domain-containing protein [Hypericibacter adhaerens]|uniref:NAD(P)-binding domain-containing protein n=1 Tax=Hypericibacter adhaerens TaxID=2602016 RepID=UPI002BEB8A52|nr:NAD(P)-binding domain-containing protein [Hypericibacter adhaerens]HWA42583.1 NAD(P)-binding domain-containing protein [Hypericibacter adhaerens]